MDTFYRSIRTNAGVHQVSSLGPTLSLKMIISMASVLKLGIYSDDRTIYSCLDSKSDRIDEVELAADVKDELQSIVNRGKGWPVTFNATKSNLFFC